MSTSQLVLNAALLAFVLVTNLGTRRVTGRRLLLPWSWSASPVPSSCGTSPPSAATAGWSSPAPSPGSRSAWPLAP